MIHDAFKAWAAAIGAEHVDYDPETQATVGTATFATTNAVRGVIQPASREEVQACVRIANQYEIALYPISAGKNWGYGSRVPPSQQAVVLDLRRLKAIRDFDDRLGTITIEAGVTQQQLYTFLQQQGGRWWVDVSGSSPEASLVGNTLERGFGHTPYSDHFGHVCHFEVVLPTSECIHTGFQTQAAAAPIFRWGLGPVLDGLFSQSNLGIVTSMSLWLMPAPEYVRAFSFNIKDAERLGSLIDTLQPLRINGTIASAIHLGNAYKVLTSIQQYPWEAMEEQTPLAAEYLRSSIATYGFGAWNGLGALYGTRAHVEASYARIEASLDGIVDSLQSIDDDQMQQLLSQVQALPEAQQVAARKRLGFIEAVYNLMKGVPSAHALDSTYWRKRTPAPADPHPDRDGCGLIWCAPVVPLLGTHAQTIEEVVHTILPRYGFEPIISLTLLSGRALGGIISIIYDRAVAGEDERAMACYKALLEELHLRGYYSYRLGIQSQPFQHYDPDYQTLLTRLKQTIDPQNILAPGRYIPTS